MKKMQYRSKLNYLAFVLILLSGVFMGFIFLVPFLAVSFAMKSILITICIIICELTWWVGVAILGKQLIKKYKRNLNPLNWYLWIKNKVRNIH